MDAHADSLHASSLALDPQPEFKPLSFVQLHPKHKPSTKRPLDDEDGLGWDNIQGYMHAKQQKLRNQFDDLQIKKKSSIFEGVAIYVNGWTQPTAEELKELINVHGGKYECNFYSPNKVTHTIATNLPNSKILNLGSSIVCTPNWITDSIAANSLLPVEGYLLYKPQDGQRKVEFSKQTVNNEYEGKELTDRKVDSTKLKGGHQGVSGNGDFVNDFFAHSRLHYLSKWSTELKQFTADMLKQISPKIPKLPVSASLKGLNTRSIVHVDIDCFFVSVSLQSKPHLRGKPIAVTHAKSSKQSKSVQGCVDQKQLGEVSAFGADGQEDSAEQNAGQSINLDSTSDIACSSYEARRAGVSNGMLVGSALKKCPDLILVPYDFKLYREVSQAFYEILLQYSSVVEAVSCDEAFIELTEYCRDSEHVSEVVNWLRNEVQVKTGCTVSAGISHNMLLSRMCTRVAKPNGQFFLSLDKTDSFISSQKVHDLPGVGHSTANKLHDMGIENCGQLRSMSMSRLQSQFGTKTGETLYEYARGVDNRELKTTTERKSVSVDINFGIRFNDMTEAETLIGNISEELQKRAEEACVAGNQITLKVKIRKQDAPIEPKKFLGHGACNNVSRSLALLQPSREASECTRLAVKLLKQLKLVATDIRGMGLQLSKLVTTTSKDCTIKSEGYSRSSIAEMNKELSSTSSIPGLKSNSHRKLKHLAKPSPSKSLKSTSKSLKDFFGSHAATNEMTALDEAIVLPPASQLDYSVLDALPTSLREEILRDYESKGDTIVDHFDVIPTHPAVKCEKDDCYVKSVMTCGNSNAEITIDEPTYDEEQFLAAWKEYIKGWVDSFIQGPVESDTIKVSEYICTLAKTNLEMTELFLKFIRRLIELQHLTPWHSCFNFILEQTQQAVKASYGGTLKIEPL